MTSSSLSKEPIRQALLVAEDLEEQFAPIASTPRDPIALLPLGDSTLIDHTLHTLKTGGIQQVLVCCSQLNQVREHLLANNWFRPATGAGDTPFVHLFPAEGLCSLGDVMREVFSSSQHLKQNDFVLVNGFVIGQVPLAQLLSEHVRRRADQDKGCALTLVMRPLDSAHPAHQYESRPLLVINRNGGKLLHFEPAVGSTLMRKPKDSLKSLKSWDHIRLPLERLRASHSLQIRTDLHETGLAICSPAIPALFVDNFDYSTRDELMHGLLVHEELLGSTLYVQTSPSANKLIGRVHNWRSYERLASDLMRGWLDLGSILSIGSTSSALDRIRLTHRVGVWRSANAHVQPNVELSGHVMLGSQCDIGDSVRLHNCMLTGPCCVGQRSVLTGTYALNDVSVGSDCRLDRCVLGSGVRILDGCHVPDGCLLGSGVQIGPNVRLPTGTRLVIQSANDSAQTIDVSLVGAKGNAILWSDDGDFNSLQNLNEDEEDDDLTDDDDDESESGYRAKSQLWGLEQGQSDTWKCDYESEDTDDDDELDDSDNDLPAAQIDNGVPSGDDAHDQSSDPSDDDMDEDSKSNS